MSDWDGYVGLLSKKFTYVNTFFDQEPQLDIMNINEHDYMVKHDFIISSDVFEHIISPKQTGFDNLLKLLKPGGTLIFSVPYTHGTETFEHYEGLHEFSVLDFYDEKILVNRDTSGNLQIYGDLVFHGGEGATLEMRVFCEEDILNRLDKAGFENIKVHDQPSLAIGYYWPPLPSRYPQWPFYAYIISAHRPFSSHLMK